MLVESAPRGESTLQVRVKILYLSPSVLWVFTLWHCANPLYRQQQIRFFRGLPENEGWRVKCTASFEGATS